MPTSGDSPKQVEAWWKEASVYQIYPASFADSNDDGIGDLPGIISKVDYLHKLGVDVIWLSPILKSPQVDMGYDISDYESIDAQYGTLEDVDKLIAALHAKGMKLLMDLVVNHTSDQHEWFKKSRASKEGNEWRDWYIWRKPKFDKDGNRKPPNNWISCFQGSAWTWDEQTQEYYLHLFCPEQPDLNWEHPPVRDAVHKIIKFWLNRGTDGFRMDVINFISKVPELPDAPITVPGSEYQMGDKYFACGPRLHEYLQGIGAILKEYGAFSVGEMPCVNDPAEIIKAVGQDRGELNMIFHFEWVNIDHGPLGKYTPQNWSLSTLKIMATKWQTFMYGNSGWNALYLENHDQPRSTSRFIPVPNTDLSLNPKVSTMLATFLACQQGTVFVYQGQEIGMTNVPVHWEMDEYKDVESQNHWKLLQYDGEGEMPESLVARRKEAREGYAAKSRDSARTPMQWDDSAHGGFTSKDSKKPWMTANPNFETVNAKAQVGVAGSVFSYWQNLLGARKVHKDEFIYGSFKMLDTGDEKIDEKICAYERVGPKGGKLLVLCNFYNETVEWDLKGTEIKDVVISNYAKSAGDFKGKFALKPFEAVVLDIKEVA